MTIMINILFIHHDLAGQFIHLLHYLSKHKDYGVFGICCEKNNKQAELELYQQLFSYKAKDLTKLTAHHYVTDLQRSVLNAQAVFNILQGCKKKGIHFDLAVSHLGWGESLYFKNVYPDTPLIGYAEFFFHAQGADAGFDPIYPVSQDFELQIKTLNAQLLLGMTECDALVTPTPWQKSLFPPLWQSQINVIHEGVDINICKPNENICFTLDNGQVLTKQDEVITYSARNLEPYRGFSIFLKAIERVCQLNPNCHIIITGGDEVSYSPKLPEGECYRENYLKTVCLPMDRVHFLGTVSYQTHIQLLQLSSVHIYLTYPFVLSWSFIEAMACGCVIIASDTCPVMDVLENNSNGIAVNFFDDQQISSEIIAVLNHPQRKKYLGIMARQKIQRYYQHQFSINQYLQLFQQLLNSTNA